MLDVFRKTVAGEGLRGLYKGLLPDMLKIAPAAGISWCARRIVHLHLISSFPCPPATATLILQSLKFCSLASAAGVQACSVDTVITRQTGSPCWSNGVSVRGCLLLPMQDIAGIILCIWPVPLSAPTWWPY